MTQTMQFYLNISPEQYLSYYQGAAKFVHVTSEDGRSLKFPASRLQKHVTHSGVRGRFQIEFDAKHKLVSLDRIK